MACDIPTAKALLEEALANHYDKRELKNIVRYYFEDKFGGKSFLNDPEESIFFDDILKLKDHTPLQYVVGKTYFFDRFLKVNESTLIPRPETEELVHLILNSKANQENMDIIDIGTGSGCIPIILKAKGSFRSVKGIDISDLALAVAKENAANYHLNVAFQELDFLNKDTWKEIEGYHCIVSNPPYIGLEEKDSMSPNVLNHEPHLALFVNDPLIFYRAIADFCGFDYNVKYLFLELNSLFAPDVVELFSPHFIKVDVVKDMQGKDRMLVAER
jgi:release factor glutamine methyltransferase